MPVYEGSRYTNAPAFTELGPKGSVITIFGLRNDAIPPHPTDIVHQFVQGDRLDLIAQRYYGDPQLRWVILDANPQFSSEVDIKPGELLAIPTFQRISSR